MINIVSYDAGHKSLAVCHVACDPKIIQFVRDWIRANSQLILALDQLDELCEADQKLLVCAVVAKCRSLVEYFTANFNIKMLARIDVCPGLKMENTTLIMRAAGAKTAVQATSVACANLVLIEDQTINTMSGEIACQLAYYYSGGTPVDITTLIGTHSDPLTDARLSPDIVLCDPRAKNSIAFGIGLELSAFYATSATLYDANKKHSKANFERFMSLFGTSEIRYKYRKLTCGDAKKGRDVADSFMQIVGHLVSVV